MVAFEAMLCGDVWMLFVIYGSSVFSSVLLSLREVRWVCMMIMSLFGFRIGKMFVSGHVLGVMLLFSDMLYMLVRYASPSGPMCLRCLMLT